MEEEVFGSFNISCPLHRNAVRQLPPRRHSRRCKSGSLDQNFFSRRGLKLTDTREKCVNELRKYLVPFHGFSPVVKSLCVEIPVIPSSQIFDLILSFPLLDDLTVVTYTSLADDKDSLDLPRIAPLPSTPPMTGSLSLSLRERLKPLARQLLSLPGGIHFEKINLKLIFEEDISSAMALVEGCSHTLKSLDLSCVCFSGMTARHCIRTGSLPLFLGEPMSAPIDLSKAAGLESVVVRVNSHTVCWVTMVLQTIPLEHSDLRQITIYLPFDSAFIDTLAAISQSLGEVIRRLWSDLDSLLVQLWELRSIRPRVGHVKQGEQGESVGYNVRCLLPEITKRGIVDLV